MGEEQNSNQLQTYRAYRVSAAGRLQGAPVIIDAPDDEQAIEQARQFVDGVGIEVWDRTRLVIALPPKEQEKS